ncbi:MAG: CHRD domain-containing protein, partial [Bacteroidia bacterium]
MLTLFSYSANAKGNLTFTAWLTGAEEVPAVNTNAKGVASFRLSENRDSLVIMALATGLSGPITGASILESRRGTTGGALISLELLQAGNRFYGVLTGTDLQPAMIAKMLSGETYINIFTAVNPNGEIRGQIELEKDYRLQSVLSGNEVVPAVSTSAFGVASARMPLDKSYLHIKAQFTGISNITGIHLALGMPGINGSNVLDLSSYLSGNRIDINIAVADMPLLETDSLLTDHIYMYVSTSTNPDGEIRGQLHRNYGLGFEADMNGAQEVPAVATNGKGLGIFKLNNNLDTLTYNIVFQGLSSNVTGAHLHLGKKGQTGSVVVNLSDSVNGNIIKGKAYGIDITKAIVSAMIRGDIYVNVHSKNHTNGEIRGQLNSTLRKTYSFELCGQQEVPAVATIALGMGIVSVNQDSASLHYKIVVDSLSSELTGAHFHKAAIGQPGDVVLPLTFQHNASFGFLGDTASATMVLMLARDIAAENIYVNIHTTNNSAGEIRGQVVDRNICSQIVSVAENKIPSAQILVYPLPFTNTLTVQINALQAENYMISLFDMQGKQLNQNLIYIHTGKNALEVDVKDCNTGLYMLQIADEKGRS